MKRFLNNYDAGYWIGLILIILSVLAYEACGQMPLSGELSIVGDLDLGDKNQDPNSYIQHLGVYSKSENAYVYGVMDRYEEIEIREAYVTFELKNLRWKLGKVQVPFGFMDLDNPTKSVFIVYPRKNYNDYGLHLATRYDIMKLEGAYIDHLNYSFKSKFLFLDGNEVISFSYANSEYLDDFSINNEFFYSSLFFNFSNVIEYNPDSGNFWTRSVFAPGILDFIGINLGYYHLNHVEQGLQDYDLTGDAFTYGFYLDMAKDVTISNEWKSNTSFNKPTIKITAKF